MKVDAAESLAEAAEGALQAAVGQAKLADPVSARRAELVRSCVWALCSGSMEPVRTVRVTNLAVTLSEAWLGEGGIEYERECLRLTLAELGVLGDLVSLSGGVWTPSPLRTVSLGATGDRMLLVGGVPTRLLPRALQDGLSYLGHLRRIRSRALRDTQVQAWLKEVGCRSQTLNDWSEVPDEPLSRWGEGVLNSQLQSFFEGGQELRILAYLPLQQKKLGTARSQFARWGALPVSNIPSRFLVRLERVANFRDEYFVAEVAGGKILRVGPLLRGGDHRRLMYYLDSLAGEPTTAELHSIQGQGGTLYLRSELPPPELRKLSALAILHQQDPQKYYPRAWKLEEEDLMDVLRVLESLGIEVIKREGKHSIAAQ